MLEGEVVVVGLAYTVGRDEGSSYRVGAFRTITSGLLVVVEVRWSIDFVDVVLDLAIVVIIVVSCPLIMVTVTFALGAEFCFEVLATVLVYTLKSEGNSVCTEV